MESYLTAEISAGAVRKNLELLRAQLSPGTRMCAVVKADCYGLGLQPLLGVISEWADCLGVATPEEALYLRDLGYERQILCLFSPCAYADGGHLRQALTEMIARGITLTVLNPDEATIVAEVATRLQASAEVHVEIDSGMCRGGIPLADAPALIEQLKTDPAIRLRGLFTHFACADEQDKSFTTGQLERFSEVVEQVGGRAGLTLHAANSAALIDMPETHLDMTRPGIAIYGYQPSLDMHNKLPLTPALRLYCRLMLVKDVRAGDSCGYGLTHKFARDSRIGLAPIGYADGYFRSLSNIAMMRVGGCDVPVLGRVSMDQVILDLTDVPSQAKVGDEVEIISCDATAPNSVGNLARLAGTVPYEITCRLGRRAKRVLVD